MVHPLFFTVKHPLGASHVARATPLGGPPPDRRLDPCRGTATQGMQPAPPVIVQGFLWEFYIET
jgi:hypothetical protein